MVSQTVVVRKDSPWSWMTGTAFAPRKIVIPAKIINEVNAAPVITRLKALSALFAFLLLLRSLNGVSAATTGICHL